MQQETTKMLGRETISTAASIAGNTRAGILSQWILRNYIHVCKIFNTQEKLDSLFDFWVTTTAKLTDEEFKRGVLGCQQHEKYMPSSAAFLEHAKGLLDFEEAFQFALEEKYPSPAIYYARKKIKNWGALDEKGQRQRFRETYKAICYEILEGEKLDTLEFDLFITAHYENKYKNASMRSIGFYYDAYYGTPAIDDNGIRDKQVNDPNFDSDKKILIVDDDECTRLVLKHFSRDLGYKAYTAYDIRSALVIYPKTNLILMDINLPDNVDGFEICRQIRKYDTTLPIIGMTALNDFEELKPEAKAAGLTAFLEKPLEFEGLRDIANKYLTCA
jgi:two-component system chemotaxis response regulator CheY